MIDKEVEIKPGLVVRHDDGLRYRVDDVRTDTTNYEQAHELGGLVVGYTQLDQGEYPIGTLWSKEEEKFRQFFTVEDKQPRGFRAIRQAIFIIRSGRSKRLEENLRFKGMELPRDGQR